MEYKLYERVSKVQMLPRMAFMWSSGAMATEIPTFTADQAKSIIEADVLLIDLRPYEKFASSHIPRSINVVYSRKSLPERVATAIPPGPPIILLSDEAGIDESAPDALHEGSPYH